MTIIAVLQFLYYCFLIYDNRREITQPEATIPFSFGYEEIPSLKNIFYKLR